MILVTVGMQLGFDRLIKAMDALAPSLEMPVIAQTGAGEYKPIHMEAHPRIAPDEFEKLIGKARLIVSHAGIGTVLSAQRCGKPIVLMPRRAGLGEHRNDHQLATSRKLMSRQGILVAMDETELADRIAQGLATQKLQDVQSSAAENLLTSVANFIELGRL